MATPLCDSVHKLKEIIKSAASQLRGPFYLESVKTLMGARRRLQKLLKTIDDELERFSPQDGL